MRNPNRYELISQNRYIYEIIKVHCVNVYKLALREIMLISDVSSVGHPVDARADVAHRA